MKKLPLSDASRGAAREVLAGTSLFGEAGAAALNRAMGRAALVEVDELEALVDQGSACRAFYVVLEGTASVMIRTGGGPGWLQEIARLSPGATIGESDLLLGEPSSATVAAVTKLKALELPKEAFLGLFEDGRFAASMARALTKRLRDASQALALEPAVVDVEGVDPELLRRLPMDFMLRHRVLPLAVDGGAITLGMVEDPTGDVLGAVREQLPGLDVRTVRLRASDFDAALEDVAAVDGFGGDAEDTPAEALELAMVPLSEPEEAPEPARPTPTPEPRAHVAPPTAADIELELVEVDEVRRSPQLDAFLRRVVAEGASDLHLCAGQRPRWRLDGKMRELRDSRRLGEAEVMKLLGPAMTRLTREQFAEHKDADFSYALEEGARFRVNIFRDHLGVSAVLRTIPSAVMSPQQLGLPAVVQQFCHLPKGLILVTGPTGSGKSTTLAAMIDYINRQVNAHIITLEDPIEFVHESRRALVNQREVGSHASSFSRALRSALRQDPDIVLIGEMRDRETVALALETAGTGHLVFGTMHTATAATTIERIIGMFPPDQQAQMRVTAADVIKGVVCQTLCTRRGGGRVAAFEVLVVNNAIGNLMREGKTHHIPSAMMTGRKLGNVLLNEDLARLVGQGQLEVQEAMAKTPDRADLAKRLGDQRQAAQPAGDEA